MLKAFTCYCTRNTGQGLPLFQVFMRHIFGAFACIRGPHTVAIQSPVEATIKIETQRNSTAVDNTF